MYREFAGLGLSWQAIAMALLYGVLKTGSTEELLFRALIAGSLSRRLPLLWANLAQALPFSLLHLGILTIAREPEPAGGPAQAPPPWALGSGHTTGVVFDMISYVM